MNLTPEQLNLLIQRCARNHRVTVEQYLIYLEYLGAWKEMYGEANTAAHWHCLRRARLGFPERNHFKRRLFGPDR